MKFKLLFLSLAFQIIVFAGYSQLNLINAFNPVNIDTSGGMTVGLAVKTDAAGNVYTTGYFRGHADFDPGAATHIIAVGPNDNIFLSKLDASGNFVYAIGLPSDYSAGRSLYVDASGNAYVCGYYSNTVDFDPGPGSTILTSSGLHDVFIAKYDPSGNLIFAFRMGSTGDDEAMGISLDGTGNIYVAGHFKNTVDFDPGAGTTNLTATNSDIFLAKYDASGVFLYVKPLSGTLDEYAWGLAVDNAGNAYIAGTFYGTVDFDPGVGTANRTSAGSNDMFFAKYDPSGNYIYAQKLGGTGIDVAYSIAADVSGNAYVTGLFANAVDFDPGAGTTSYTAAGSSDVFFGKYDTAGNMIFAKRVGSTSNDWVREIALDASGNIFLTGNFGANFDTDPGAGTAVLNSGLSIDVYLAKYDPSGNYLFAINPTGAGSDNGGGLTLNGIGDVIITGNFTNTVDFDPTAGTANLSTAANSSDLYIAKYTNAGNYTWAKGIGRYSNNSQNEEGRDVVTDAAGNTYITGVFAGTVDFDNGPGVFSLSSTLGSYGDVFLAKYNSAGGLVFARQMGTAIDPVQSFEISLDPSGNLYWSGAFNGTIDFDPGPGTTILVSNLDDIFIAKYNSSGALVYAKGFGGSNYDYCTGMVTDATGNIYITGYFYNTIDFDPGAGTANLTASASGSGYFAKYDPSGNFIFVKHITGTGGVNRPSIATDPFGNYWISGGMFGTIDLDPGAGTASVTSSGGEDIFLEKFDAAGIYITGGLMGGAATDEPRSVHADPSGNIWITGVFNGSSDMNPGAGTTTISTNGLYDIFIAKYTNSLSLLFAKGIGSTVDDFSEAINIDASGNAYITGYFLGTMDLDPGAGSNIVTPVGAQDSFLAKYDSTGSFVEGFGLGGVYGDSGKKIFIDGSQNVHLTGYFSGTVDFDPSATSETLQSINSSDAFFAVYGCAPPDVPVVSSTAAAICNGASTTLNVGSASLNAALQWKWYSGSCGGTAIDSGALITVTPIVTTTYYVRGEGGCASPGVCASYTITVNPIPVISATTDETHCNDDLVSAHTFTSVPVGASFAWTNSNTSIGIGASGVGNLSAFTATNTTASAIQSALIITPQLAGCYGNPDTFNITVNPSADASFSYSALAYCQTAPNQIPTITGVGGGVFSSTPAGLVITNTATGDIDIATSTVGTYTVTYTNFSVCPGQDSVSFTIDAVAMVNAGVDDQICAGNTYTLSGFDGGTAVSSLWTSLGSGSFDNTGILNATYMPSPMDSVAGSVILVLTANTAGVCGSVSDSMVLDLTCQVWPGDANNDFVVDNTDLLPIGIYFSQTGASRSTISNAWQAYPAANWGTAQLNGSDIKHSDCNGDGLINDNDTMAINLNYSSFHAMAPIVNEYRSSVPDLYFSSIAATYIAGDWIDIDIMAGSVAVPVDDLYGLAFNFNYDAALVQPGTESIIYPNSWFTSPGTDGLTYANIQSGISTAFCAETRKDHLNADGFGRIATFRFQASSAVATSTNLNLAYTFYTANDSVGNNVPFNTLPYSIVIDPVSTGITESWEENFTVSPNPFGLNTTVSYKLMQNSIVSIELYNSLGQKIRTLANGDQVAGTYNINIDGSKGEEAGIYYLRIVIGGKLMMKRIVKTQ